tara:strand:- start:115 stop:306 length:192 start_codon:yes stop_codon:yes gene_type:complete
MNTNTSKGSKVIRVSSDVYAGLQSLAVPFDDTPCKTIALLLDFYNGSQKDSKPCQSQKGGEAK